MIRTWALSAALVALAAPTAAAPPATSSPRFLFWDAKPRAALLVDAEGKTEKVLSVPAAVRGTVVDLAYSPRSGRLAVLISRKTSKAEQREILVIDTASGARTSIERRTEANAERQGAGFGDTLQAEGLGELVGFSPDGTLLAYTRTGFEFCEVVLSTVDGKRKLSGEGCCGRWGLRWSPSGSTLAYFSAASMDTADTVGFLGRAELDGPARKLEFHKVDWKKVGGDKSSLYEPSYDGKSKNLSRFVAATFLDENRLLLVTEDQGQRGYAVYDRARAAVRLVRATGDIPWSADTERVDVRLHALFAPDINKAMLHRLDLGGKVSSIPVATEVQQDLSSQPSCRKGRVGLFGCSGGRCLAYGACDRKPASGHRFYVLKIAPGQPMKGWIIPDSGHWRLPQIIEP